MPTRFVTIVAVAFAIVQMATAGVVRAQDADDTAAILALSEIGAQLRLNNQKIIGVTLEGEDIDDESLRLLKGLDRLQSLTLNDTQVTGDGLKQLKDLKLLGSLAISGSSISDRDIDELAALPGVTHYELRGTRISGMGKQRLERQLENAKRDATVHLHFGGFLGVSGIYDTDRCLLTSVVSGSAASEAGLQVGDVIVKFNGQNIGTFRDLADAVALTSPEQPIPVIIERDGATKTFTASLQRSRPPQPLAIPP